MRASIAVMNTKGGVGESTLVLALAETLSAMHGKTVLVIDSDAQASISSMLMSINSLHRLQSDGLTIVDYLVATVLNGQPADWSRFVVGNVSDVDESRTVYVLPSDMQLTLFEREVSKESLHGRLRAVIGALLAEVSRVFDVVLIDCPPGLSVLTESWLREAEFHISPTKADYVSVCGLEVFRRFKALNPEMGFAENLGVIVNMKDDSSASDNEYHRWLADNADNRCFSKSVPRMGSLQDAARFRNPDRSYLAKYPGIVGAAVRSLTDELVERLQHARAQAASRSAPLAGSVAASPSTGAAAAGLAMAASAAGAPEHAVPHAVSQVATAFRSAPEAPRHDPLNPAVSTVSVDAAPSTAQDVPGSLPITAAAVGASVRDQPANASPPGLIDRDPPAVDVKVTTVGWLSPPDEARDP